MSQMHFFLKEARMHDPNLQYAQQNKIWRNLKPDDKITFL
jgi:hypothetical protein